VNRLSRESAHTQSSPLAGSLPFSSGQKVGRKVISKIKVGGKKIGAATKHTIDKLGDMSITGEKRSSGEMRYEQPSPRQGGSPYEKPGYSPESRITNDSPLISRSELPAPGEFAASSYRDPESRSDGSGAVGLGLSAPNRPYGMEGANPSASSLTNTPSQPQSQTWDEQTPTSPRVVMSKKEAKGHGYSSSMSGGKVSKFFGSLDPSNKRSSGSSLDTLPTQQRQSSSPKQKSKFGRFMSDLSHQDITGKNTRAVSHSAVMDRPPPPPDKAQYRAPSGGPALRNMFSDLNNRDITGARPQDKPKGARAPTFGSAASAERTSGGGFGRFFSDLSKRDITGQTEEERQAALRQREQENTHLPATAQEYDESASDWEVKMDKMEDVLPHIPKARLAEALKKAGGDEHRAIGLAVINSR
jgi:hypothetical protein